MIQAEEGDRFECVTENYYLYGKIIVFYAYINDFIAYRKERENALSTPHFMSLQFFEYNYLLKEEIER